MAIILLQSSLVHASVYINELSIQEHKPTLYFLMHAQNISSSILLGEGADVLLILHHQFQWIPLPEKALTVLQPVCMQTKQCVGN